MNPRSDRPLALSLTIAAVTLAARLASADACPPSEICANGCTSSTLPARSVIGYAPCVRSGGSVELFGAYDLPQGTIGAHGTGCINQAGVGSSATGRDVFRIVGPASGAPISFTVRMHVSGSVTGGYGDLVYADVVASLQSGNASDRYVLYALAQDHLPFQHDLSVVLTHTVGEVFLLEYSAQADEDGAGSFGSINGTLSFEGLPAGYAAVSWQGFVSDRTVSSRAASWGRLKTIYR